MTETVTFNTPHAQLFPPLASYELADLRADIEQNGIKVPIVVQASTNDVLDGHHRYLIAQDLGLVLREGVEYELVDTDWPVAWAIRFNLNRRNLGVDAEGVVRRERQRLAFEMSDAGMTQQDIASQLGVSQPTVANWLNNDDLIITFIGADKSNKPKPGNRVKLPPKERQTVIARLAAGETQQQVAADYKVSQPTIAKVVAKAKAQQAEADAREITLADVTADASGDGWKLLAGDFRDRLNDLPDGSIDLIVTDPPYPRDFIDLWEDLAKHAARVLKPQGVLVGLTGQIMLPEVMDRLGAHLQYGWVYCQPLPGANSRIMARHVLQSWKPWLAYSNGQWPSGQVAWHEDLLDPSARTKSQFRWEQDGNPAEYLIEVLSQPGATVLDPFAGSGTYGLTALGRGRQFIGVEADETRLSQAAERLGA